jgi:hypothetical protein
MEISKMLQSNPSHKAKFAFLDKETCEFLILKTPSRNLPWRNLEISLKDVQYAIINGVLYIKGIRIYYYDFDLIFDSVAFWGSRLLYKIHEERNQKLEHPHIANDIYIKKWWWKNKKLKGFDFTVTGLPKDQWFKIKKEDPYEIALSSFKIIEKYHE